MIWNVAYVVGSAVGSGGAARPRAEGIVSPAPADRPAGASAWETVLSARPGSGKTVLLRSWISQAGAASCAAGVLVALAEHDTKQFWLPVLATLRQTDPGAVLVRPLTAESGQNAGQLRLTLLRRGAFTVQIRRLQPMRIGSKNGRETGDDDLRGAW